MKFRAAWIAVVACVLAHAAPASAYPWLITHGYASCGACHVDPSGAGQLTTYGRGMDDVVVRWHADMKEVESGDVAPSAGYLFGLVNLPEWLNLSGNFRGGGLINVGDLGGKNTTGVYPLVMAVDLNGTVNVDKFVAHLSLGYGLRQVGPAMVISEKGGPNNGLVSREHWAGYKLFDDSLMIRVGRMPLPFGLRNNEHTSFVRAATFTDGNISQQHGVAVSYANDVVRGELMGIAGNFQIRPDAVRERGYSGYFEYDGIKGLSLGASSLFTYAQRDLALSVPHYRQAHGVFLRASPVESLAIMGEADLLVNTYNGTTQKRQFGYTGLLQVDWAPIQGVHIVPALEALELGDGTTKLPTMGAWASVAWYLWPHTELRVDNVFRTTFPATGAASNNLTTLLQLHLFL